MNKERLIVTKENNLIITDKGPLVIIDSWNLGDRTHYITDQGSFFIRAENPMIIYKE